MSFDLPIPALETERLILRQPQERDLEGLIAFWGSERSQFIGGPLSRLDTWRKLTSMIGQWVIKGYGFYMLEEKTTGTVVGGTGIVEAEGWSEPELGWNLYETAEGKGYAFEAAQKVREHAATTWGITAPISHIDADNTRSIALAERLGARFERDGDISGHPVRIYRHAEWGVN